MAGAVPDQIAAALARGATVLTGNQRAARALRRNLAPTHLAAPPAIFAWSTWTASLWHQLLLDGATDRMLLNRTQEHALWREILRRDQEIATLRSVDDLADMAAGAWATLARYRGLGRLRGSATNSDTAAFIRWAAAFEDTCRKQLYLPQARLEDALRQALQARTLRPQPEILLTGFDRLLPAQAALLEALREAGTGVSSLDPPPLPRQRSLAAQDDASGELRAAALWLRQYLETHPDPGTRVAVVAANLAEARPLIDRTFRELLAPAMQSLATAAATCPFEFAATLPLVRHPMIAAALDLLAWPLESLTIERVSDLLLSPYFARGQEPAARAELDAFDLRTADRLRPEITLTWLIGAVERSQRRTRLPILLAALRDLHAAAARRLGSPAERLHGEWAEAMRSLLHHAGWSARPGEDSAEFQTRERWESLLDELATLDFEGTRVAYDVALETLHRMARETIFAPAANDAPIQIMGPEETAGQSFDAVWFLGASDLDWPSPQAPNPLLSWPLCRELGIPGSDAEADFEQARRVTARIAGCAREAAVFSYAMESDEGKQRPSRALEGLDLQAIEIGLDAAQASPPVALETVAEAPLPPLAVLTLTGGTSVLKSQAACSFRAFAEHRLYASAIDTATLGMDAAQRGTAVHAVLETFWSRVETQAALKLMTVDERKAVLSEAIDQAFSKPAALSGEPWDTAYLDTQRARLLTLGLEWLAVEEARPLGFRVTAREAVTHDAQVGPLRLNLRLDRIDEIEDGGSLLIDYKTGPATPSSWLTDRPDEPQLPLYASVAAGLRLRGVAFAKLRPGKEMALTGYQDTPGILPRGILVENLAEQVEGWRRVLNDLATAFAEGDIRVAPKHYPETCKFCQQRLLCRLDIASLAEDIEDQRGAEDDDG
jgi:ATP-dependent helicase/nuclease subunit B